MPARRLSKQEFREILIRTRDDLLRHMRKDGFYVWKHGRHVRSHSPITWDINAGLCEEFMATVIRKVAALVRQPGDVRNNYIVAGSAGVREFDMPDYAHTAVKFNGRIYDAECIEGVDDWRKLPLVVNEGRGRPTVGRKCSGAGS